MDLTSAYDAELIARGCVFDTVDPLPRGEDSIEDIRLVRLTPNIFDNFPCSDRPGRGPLGSRRYIGRYQMGTDVIACLFAANH